MTTVLKAHTHTAFVFKREGKRPNQGRWHECGIATLHDDGTINVLVNLLPVGGFNGRLHLAKAGTQPPPPEFQPQRPGLTYGDGELEG